MLITPILKSEIALYKLKLVSFMTSYRSEMLLRDTYRAPNSIGTDLLL